MKKVPKIFNNTYKEKKFRKKILKKIYTSNDKAWVESLFEEKDGLYKLKEKGFSKEELKRLKQLEKSIKKNKGLFNKKLLLPLVIIISALIVFNILILDSLLEKTLEIQLGNTLETKVYVEKLDLKLLKGQLSIGALAVEEAGSEKLNLLIENVEARINTSELLKKKVFIEELSFKTLAFDVQPPYAMKSAWNPADGNEAESDQSPEDTKESISLPLPEIPDLDPQSIWEFERENLALFKASQGMQEKYETLYKERMKQIDEGRTKSEAVVSKSKSIMDAGFGDLKNPAKIQERVKELDGFKSEITEISGSVKTTYNNVKNDVNSIKQEALSLKDNFSADKEYLLSKTKQPEGGLKTLASDLATSYIKKNFSSYYSKAMKFKGYYDKALVIKNKTGKEKKQRTGRRTGRTLDFNQRVSPSFVLQKASGSWQISESRTADMNLGDMTSDPGVWGKDPFANASYKSSRENWMMDAKVPFETENLVASNVNGSGISLKLTEYLSTLGLDGINADMDITTSPALTKNNVVSGDLAIILNNVSTKRKSSANLIQKKMADVLEEAGEIVFDGSYEVQDSGKQTLKLKSNLDDLLKNAVKDIMAEKAAEARAAMEEYLNDYLADVLKNNEELLGKFGLQESLLDQDLTSMDTYKNLLDDQKNSVSDSLNAETDKLKAQAQAEVDKARDQAQEEADKLKTEAEAKAKKAADKIKVPGW